MGLSPWFGNVILGVVDLAATAGHCGTVGLDVQEGGTHPGFGTRNMIVPLGRSYLELLAVEDRARAEQSLFGRTLLARTAEGDRLVRWSIRTDRIDEVAADLDLEVDDRSRLHPDGRTLRWRSAGHDAVAPRPQPPVLHAMARRRLARAPSRPGTAPMWARSSGLEVTVARPERSPLDPRRSTSR